MALGTTLNLTRDAAGNNTFGLPDAPFKYQNSLVASTEKTLTVPGTYAKYSAIFAVEPGAEVWYAKNNTAVLPVAGEFIATNSELNPVSREVKAGDILHFITGNADARIGVVLYPISPF